MVGKKNSPFVNQDTNVVRNEYIFKPPRIIENWLLNQMHDTRDAAMMYLIFDICCLVLPSAFLMFWLSDPPIWLGICYFVLNSVCFTQRFILCLHYVEHLQPFKNTITGRILSALCPYILCVLYGIPPGIYRLHHVVMHHCENNLFPWDVSSTEPYQRDSFLQFLCYWVRFWTAIAFELPWYAFRRGRYLLAAKSLWSLFVFIGGSAYLYQIRPTATLWVILIPFALSSFALMFGNWSQHAFINPANPRNNYTLTYNVVNCADNQKTFNDGYHIIHHINSKVHWLDLPARFMETLDKHAEEDALVFEGIGFSDVGFLVFTGQLGALADRYVNIGQQGRTKEELVSLFKHRLQPIKYGQKVE